MWKIYERILIFQLTMHKFYNLYEKYIHMYNSNFFEISKILELTAQQIFGVSQGLGEGFLKDLTYIHTPRPNLPALLPCEPGPKLAFTYQFAGINRARSIPVGDPSARFLFLDGGDRTRYSRVSPDPGPRGSRAVRRCIASVRTTRRRELRRRSVASLGS